MKSIKATKASLVCMSVLSAFMCNLPTPAVADPGTLGSAASFGVFGGGAGMTNQGVYTVINGDIGTTADTTLVSGFHDLNAVFTETPKNIGTVKGRSIQQSLLPVPYQTLLPPPQHSTFRQHLTACLLHLFQAG